MSLIVMLLGVAAFMLRSFGFPVAPVLLGLVIGPMLEQELRRSLAMASGDADVLLQAADRVGCFGARRGVDRPVVDVGAAAPPRVSTAPLSDLRSTASTGTARENPDASEEAQLLTLTIAEYAASTRIQSIPAHVRNAPSR